MENLKSYFSRCPEVLLAYIFRSAVKKQTHRLSDIDLAIYSDPTLIGKNDIIPLEFAQKIRGMASFRNILVHDYATVDLEKLHQILNNNLGDFGNL